MVGDHQISQQAQANSEPGDIISRFGAFYYVSLASQVAMPNSRPLRSLKGSYGPQFPSSRSLGVQGIEIWKKPIGGFMVRALWYGRAAMFQKQH